MFKFSETSTRRLIYVHPILHIMVYPVLSVLNIGISAGHRNKHDQDAAFMSGLSKLQFPESKHNKSILLNDQDMSDAVDIVIYVNNTMTFDSKYYIMLNGIMQNIANNINISALGLKLIWGGNWDSDEEIITDQSFNDLCHFELIKT